MAIPDNYIDKITKGNDSRMISPAADMVRVDNENFEGADLDEVLNEVAQAIEEAGSGAVSVIQPDPADGTFIIRVGSTDYTINLNHTHEGMAKLVVDTAANLPDVEDMEEDTIYGEVEDGEISVLYVGGIPFYGGGGGGGGTPALRQPADNSIINVGTLEPGASSIEMTIPVKGRNLTQALAVAVTGTGYTIKNGVSSIAAADANVGTTLTIVCSSSATGDGTLSIASSEVSCDCVLKVSTYTALTAVKFTGSQWLQTDYRPNPNTEFELDFKFTQNTNSTTIDYGKTALFDCEVNTGDGGRFRIFHGKPSSYSIYGSGNVFFLVDSKQVEVKGVTPTSGVPTAFASDFFNDHSKLKYVKGQSSTTCYRNSSSKTIDNRQYTMENPMRICYGTVSGITDIYGLFDVTVYELTITEGGNTVRHWVPMSKDGIPGLYDTINHTFITSETSTELVAIS